MEFEGKYLIKHYFFKCKLITKLNKQYFNFSIRSPFYIILQKASDR